LCRKSELFVASRDGVMIRKRPRRLPGSFHSGAVAERNAGYAVTCSDDLDGLTHVALVVLRDEEDLVGGFRLGADDGGQRRNGSVPVAERVDKIACAVEDRARHGLLEDIGRFYLSTYPLTAACSTAGSPHTGQWRGPPVFAVQTPRPGTHMEERVSRLGLGLVDRVVGGFG
jgi:hypothetical protein